MKNTLKLTTAVALALALNATPSHANFKSGFVVGGALGYSHMGTRFTNNSSESAFIGVAAQSSSARTTEVTSSASSIIGSLSAGYRYITESGFAIGFNLGVSKDGNTSKDNGTLTTVNSIAYTTKLNRQFQITPALFIGQRVADNWMVFTELGLSISRFKLKAERTATAANTNPVAASNKSFTKVGFAPTIGVECALSDRISVTGTATYEYFGSTKKDVGSTNTRPGAIDFQTQNNVKVQPNYFTAKVGVLFKI